MVLVKREVTASDETAVRLQLSLEKGLRVVQLS